MDYLQENSTHVFYFQNGLLLPTAREVTVQPSSSFVLSKQNVKQTKAQVYESSQSSTTTSMTMNSNSSSNYSVIKPSASSKDLEASDRLLEEYMSKLNQLNNNSAGQMPNNGQNGQMVSNLKKPVNLPKRSESSDNVLTNEFMRVREEKFGKLSTNVEQDNNQEILKENKKNLAKNGSSTSKHNCYSLGALNGAEKGSRPLNDSTMDETNCLLKEIDGIMGE